MIARIYKNQSKQEEKQEEPKNESPKVKNELTGKLLEVIQENIDSETFLKFGSEKMLRVHSERIESFVSNCVVKREKRSEISRFY